MLWEAAPAVFAVGREYQITLILDAPAFYWVRVKDAVYRDEVCGVMCSNPGIRRVSVPISVLDSTGAYTVCVEPVVLREPYQVLRGSPEERTFSFHPLPRQNPRVYHIADTHGLTAEPIRAAQVFDCFDLLILNGDIANHGGTAEKYLGIFRLASELTGGELPVIYARGNHELRGAFAERISDYAPT